MHQEHNIAWNTLASNLAFIRNNSHITPCRTNLFAADRPNQGRELHYFVKTLAKTISAFAETERAKYPKSFDAPTSGKLFSDELLNRYPEFLNTRNQLIENWIARGRCKDPHFPKEYLYGYNTSHGDLADVIKVLFHENDMPTLLMLASHPQIALRGLCNLSWGHHFGFSRVAESALISYIFFNVIAAKNMLFDKTYKELYGYTWLERYLTSHMDYDGQQIPHWAFFHPEGYRIEPSDAPDNHNRLHKYVKDLFRTLYQYDVVMRECDLDPEWENEAVSWIANTWNIKCKYTMTEDGYVQCFT